MAKTKKKTQAQAELFAPEAEPLSPKDTARVAGLSAELAKMLADLPLAARVEALNLARRALHEVSPFKSEPVDCVQWIPAAEVAENDWNPNAVPPPEFVALTHSVRKYGYTMPIVGVRIHDPEPGSPVRVRITDGKHRNVVGRVDQEIRNRIHGYLPLSLLGGSLTRADEMSATVLHNQARGTHSVERELTIVAELADAGWDDAQMGVGLVKSEEELVRMRQLGGAAKNLASQRYAKAWDF